ncbi:MAG: hypothetical protein HC778_05435 [Chamaesiphon sp. CSU_1_12]|nr:hypothetical protein [Chamaesiphon sp. CSU_1_12]
MLLIKKFQNSQISIVIISGSGIGLLLLGSLLLFNMNLKQTLLSQKQSSPQAIIYSPSPTIVGGAAQTENRPVSPSPSTIPSTTPLGSGLPKPQSESSQPSPSPIIDRTQTTNSNCPSGKKTFVTAETKNFLIYICGDDRPTEYIGMAKMVVIASHYQYQQQNPIDLLLKIVMLPISLLLSF